MLYPASVKAIGGTCWGYIDERGIWRIQPEFETAAAFQDAPCFAVVQRHGRAGLINYAGQVVVPFVWDWISDYSQCRATASNEHGYWVIDEYGRLITNAAYPYISNYSDGRAMFYQTIGDQLLYGYLDLQGQVAIPAAYLDANDFQHGRAVVKIKDGEYALIGLNGERLATYPYAFVGPSGDGLMAFRREENGKYGYINEQGQIVIPPQYTGAMPFQDGVAVINTAEDFNNSYGLINRNGNILIQPEFNSIELLHEQRVALGRALDPEQPYIGSLFAISDLNGRLLTDFRFREVNPYQHSLASVNDDWHTYFVDRTGQPAAYLPRFSGSGTLVLMNSLIQANIDQRMHYYDCYGKLIWAQNTIIPLCLPYFVREIKFKSNRQYLVYYPQVEGMSDLSTQHAVNQKLKELSQVKEIPPGQLDYTYNGDFDVSFFRHQLLQLLLTGYYYPLGAAHGMPSQIYVHLNLTNGRMYELKDLFKAGSPYVELLSEIVGEQIKNDPQYDYVFEGSYQGTQPDQPFFVTDNALHLYFKPYDIAPYAAGFPTFTIPFNQILSIIDTNGEFWRSFH